MNQKELLKVIEEAKQDGRKELDLSQERLTQLPAEIGKLTNLTHLYLPDNRLTELPPEIGKLTQLTWLDLGRNELTELPPEIGKLTQLATLELGGNRLTELTPAIGKLTLLTDLDLCESQLIKFPLEIVKLSHLESLSLCNNRLTELPANIGKLTALALIDLQDNQLTTLPAEIGKLTNLTHLYLLDNRLTELPPEISHLKKLEYFDLDTNRLTTLPSEIGKLSNLKLLNLGSNLLRALPLSILDLGLPFVIDNHDWPGKKRAICLSGNPMISPPLEIIRRGREAMEDWFEQDKGERLKLNEAKILLVGDGGAGKTSLVKRIIGQQFNPDEGQTDGINIDKWSVTHASEEIKLNIWDFGGQQIMHGTHQFFLSERSLYVLVLDGRKEEDTEYWLKHIESFGGDSPILVVLNKMDENPGFDVNRRFLQRKYEGIHSFHKLSCKTDEGLESFRRALSEALGEVSILQTPWPTSWAGVKADLESMDDPYISLDKYQKLCSKHDLADTSGRETLVKFLHDLGIIVHFSDFQLQDTHILEPRWLTGAVYRIINSKELAEAHGILKLKSLKKILSSDGSQYEYPVDKHPYIVDVMKKFELCYSIDKSSILIPDLLEVQEPKIDFDYDKSLQIYIDFDFLPRSIMPRFIVKKHLDINGTLRWRTGCVLKDEAFDATAVIKSNDAERRISIFVDGNQRREYLTVIRSTFLSINRAFEKLDYIERVPLPDKPEVSVSYNHLVKLEQERVEEYIPDGAEHPYKVRELLGNLYVEPKHSEEEFIEILKRIVADSDSDETILQKANDIIKLQPGLFGVSVNLNALISRFIGKSKKRPKT